MKTSFLLFVFIFCLGLLSFSQTEEAFADSAKEEVKKVKELSKFLDLSLGYVPKTYYSAIKANIGINNILLKRFGAYTSVEFGKNNYFMNIIGITGSINNTIYLYGGLDFFTADGLISEGSLKHTRKEFGIGILPYKWTEVRLAWSESVGPSISIGAKIPLN